MDIRVAHASFAAARTPFGIVAVAKTEHYMPSAQSRHEPSHNAGSTAPNYIIIALCTLDTRPYALPTLHYHSLISNDRH